MGGAPTLSSSPTTLVTPVVPTNGYELALRVESYDEYLLYLAQFPLNAGGAFTVAVDLALRVDPPFADRGRVMLYLLACDVSAVAEILRMTERADYRAGSGDVVPPYCAIADKTLGDLCVSFPLEDHAADDAVVYRAQAVVSGTAVRDLGIRSTVDAGPTTFFLDACEAVGGTHGVLRSCLNPTGDGGECFYCPSLGASASTANCSVPPAVRPTVTGGVWMDLCDSSGACLSPSSAYWASDSSRAALPLFYALAALAWGAAAFVWSVHIQAASGRTRPAHRARTRALNSSNNNNNNNAVPIDNGNGNNSNRRGSRETSVSRPSRGRDSAGRVVGVAGPPPPPAAQIVVELQQKMRGVPLSQCVACALTSAALYLEGSSFYSPSNSSSSSSSSSSPTALVTLATNAAALATLLALALLCEMLLLLAKGWQVTRVALPPRERQWLRVLTLCFAILTSVLRYSQRAKHVAVVLLWGGAWAAVVGSIWFYSALNLNALRYQLAVLRQHLLALQQQQAGGPSPGPADVRRTPVYVKLQLFRRFRGLLALYLFLSCVMGVAGLATDAADAAWQWTTLAGGDGLTFLLFAALGYTFRCRRFRELLPPSARRDSTPNGANRVVPEPAAPSPPPLLVRKKSAMVVFVNPDKEHALGTAYTTEKPAEDGKK